MCGQVLMSKRAGWHGIKEARTFSLSSYTYIHVYVCMQYMAENEGEKKETFFSTARALDLFHLTSLQL